MTAPSLSCPEVIILIVDFGQLVTIELTGSAVYHAVLCGFSGWFGKPHAIMVVGKTSASFTTNKLSFTSAVLMGFYVDLARIATNFNVTVVRRRMHRMHQLPFS